MKIFPLLAVLSIALLLQSCSGIKVDDSRTLWVEVAPRSNIWSAEGAGHTPVIAGDTIYYRGGYGWLNKVWLHAVDKKTGKLLWKTENPISQFEVDGDKIFAIATPNFYKSEPDREHETHIYCLAASTGKLRWKMKAETDLQNIRILSIGTYLYVIPNPSMIAAVDKETGKIVWQRDQEFYQSRPDITCVLGEKDQIFAAQPDQSVKWINGLTGKSKAKVSLPASDRSIPQSISLSDGVLFIRKDDQTFGYADPKTLEVKGPFPCGAINGDVLKRGRTLFFGCTTGYALVDRTKSDTSTSTSEGKKPAPADETKAPNPDAKSSTAARTQLNAANKKANKLVVDDTPLAPNVFTYSYVNAFDMDRGDFAWITKLDAPVTVSPSKVDNLILVGTASDDCMLYALDKDSGEGVWKVKCSPVAAPVAAGGVIYVNGAESLYAVDKASGKTLWTYKPRQFGPAGSPAVDGNVVYMSANDSNLYAIKIDSEPAGNNSPGAGQ